MTATREIVADQREQFAFHDDIVYLRETKRGLTRATVEEISGFKDEPDWMLQFRLRAYEHFLKRADAGLDRRPRPDRLRQDRLLPQAVRARREVVGRRPRADQGDVRAARHPRGGAQVPRRRRRPVRLRGRLPLGQRGADEDRRRVHGHRPGAQGIPRDLQEVLRHGRAARGQQVRRAQQRGLVGRLVRLRAQGRRGPAAAAGLLPHQRREHRPVRADADRRRRGRQGPLHRGLHGADLRHRLAPRRGRRGRRAAGLARSATRPSRTGRTTSTTSSPSAPTRTRTARSSGSTRTPARARPSSSRPSTCAARARPPTSSASRSPARASTRTPAPRPSTSRPNTRSRIVIEVGLQGRRPGDVPRPAQGRAGRHERRRQRPLRRADARRREPQRHVPVHRHPGRRHDDDPRGHRREDQRGPGLLPDEPRPDRERGAEPHRPGLPRGLHQGTADGVRHRVQPPREAGDGGVARVDGPGLDDAAARAAGPRRAVPARRRGRPRAPIAADVAGLARRRPPRRLRGVVERLPGESNLLYTPYIDLRGAQLDDATRGRRRRAHSTDAIGTLARRRRRR